MPGNPFAVSSQQPAVSPQPNQPGGNPFAVSGQKPKKQQEQQPVVQPSEQPQLPDGAQGLDANGQPYFGEGISGILKQWKYNYTKDVKQVDNSEWIDLKTRWQTATANQGDISKVNMTPEEAAARREQLSVVGGALSKAWQAGEAQGSLLSSPLKAVGASVTALGELFSLPARYTEQGLGAIEASSLALNDIIYGRYSETDQNAFVDFVKNHPLDNTSTATNLALSPSDNKWEYLKMKTEEGWQSGRILYSQVFDATLKEKYLQEYRQGGDPALIAQKLQNPLAELGGQLAIDPFNLVGAFGKAAKTAKELELAHDSLTASGLLKLEKGAEAFKVITTTEDDVTAIKALDTLVEAQKEAVQLATGKSRLLNVRYGINDLTTTSRINAVVSKGKTLLGNMALVLRENGMSYDAVAEAVLYGAKSVSENADEMKAGLSALSHLPNANMWLSDDYIETFSVVKNLLTGESGALDGSRLAKLWKISNPAEFADEATKLMRSAAHAQLPNVDELANAAKLASQATHEGGTVTQKTLDMAKAYEQLPNHVKYLNEIDKVLAAKIKNPINNILSKFYFNWQGGVAVRNIVSNNELILIDKGAGAWFKDGKYWSTENVASFIEDVYGTLPESTHGFESLVSASTGKKATIGLKEIQQSGNFLEKIKTIARGFKEQKFGLAMNVGEEGSALRLVGASVRDTFKTMIPKAMPDLRKEVQAGVLTQKQVDKFTSMLLKNNGNVARTIEQFREFYKTGAVEAWRNLDFVSSFERDGLEGMGYWQDIEELAQRGATSQADVEAAFEKIRKSIDSRSELATKDVIGLSADHPNAETWGDLMKAVEEGHLDPAQHQVFTAIMESAEQARLEYQTLLDDVAMKAMDTLNQEGKVQEARHIGQEMNRVRDTLRKAGPATAKETHTITQDAWRWADAIKAEKKPTPEFLKGMWTKAGLNGDPPLDLTKQSLLKELFKQRFEKVTAAWNSSFDAIVAESETVLKQMGGVVDTTELDAMASRTRQITKQAQALRSATFEKGALRIRPAQDVAYVAKQYGVSTEEILNAINNKLPEGAQAFGKIEDVPTNQVMDVLEQVRQEKGLPELQGIAVPPPHALGSQPSLPRAWNESARGAKYTLDRIKNEILARWGQTDNARQVDAGMEEVLSKISQEVTPKMAETKAIALRVAEQQREFTLLNYGKKTYGDVALSYLMPYHFFYTRSYKNWVSRIATDPEILAGYGKYKGALEGINKDLPDWYKQQVDVTKLLGIKTDHPLFFNLEATFNPLYGLTGTDFNDPQKRTNWATATMDDMGKFGPTLWAPIQMAIAAKLFADGNTDAASRWGNRLIPETAQIKAVSSLFGKPIELDPAVNFFSGGIDPYERGRMGYSAGLLVQSGQYTPEQMQEQFQAQSGPGWDQAYQLAVQSRAASSVSSYFLGVGFKPRSTNDVTIEEMQTSLNKLYAMSDTMSSEQFKQQWEQIRSSYPDGMMDTVLLARKGGDKRDSAYAFSVLGRLPPGEMGDAFKAIGISTKDVSKFYDSKGFTDPNVKWTPTEKQRFMAAIVDLGAMLKIPDSATRQEWTNAKTTYTSSLEDISKQLGMPYEKDARGKVVQNGVWEMVSHYYDLKDDNKQAAAQFKEQHPEVQMALQLKGEAITNSPLLSAYYGGLDNIEAYLSGKVREQLSQKYGKDIYDEQTAYFDSPNPKIYLRAHPELKRFWTDKRLLDAQTEQMFFEFGSKLPEGRGAQFRPDFTPQSGVQETLYNQLQPQNAVPAWEEVSQGMPQWLQDEVANYAFDQKPVSKRATTELDYLAQQGGYYNAKDLLRVAALSLQKGTQPQQAQPTGNPFAGLGQ